MALVNPFDHTGNWYKANFHCHTTTSDGEATLEERIEQYHGQGYSILAITDHEKTNDINSNGAWPDGFLVISGMETHPHDTSGIGVYHLVCLNVPHGFSLLDEPDANTRIQKVRDVGGEVIIAHPYWCSHNLTHLLPLKGTVALEVYNATCSKVAKAFSSVHWDDLLAMEYVLPAVAVDDTHRGRDIFMGWTMLRMESLSVEGVLEALRTGCFYASCGPEIYDFRVVDGMGQIRCSPAAEVHLISRHMFGHSVYADDGVPITEVSAPVDKWPSHVRAEVVDEKGNRAWANPILLPKKD